jgi:hypothetical protein
MAESSLRPKDAEPLLAAIATELQGVPAAAPRTSLVAASVVDNNARVAQASLALLRMADHPGTFDPWCRLFAATDDHA